MSDMFGDAIREAISKMADDAAAYARGEAPRETTEYPPVRKYGHQVKISTDQALAYGLITEEQARERGWTPPPPIPRRKRIRWAIRSWWFDHRPHLHLGPCEQEEDW